MTWHVSLVLRPASISYKNLRAAADPQSGLEVVVNVKMASGNAPKLLTADVIPTGKDENSWFER